MMFPELDNCILCPQECHLNRNSGNQGYCRTGAGFSIASICIHRGEEPVIGGKDGICNIFFTGCNLSCIYCQNYEISKANARSQPNRIFPPSLNLPLSVVLEHIYRILDQGIQSVGFVSPSHVIPQVKAIIHALRSSGRNPVFVYNTNGYDKVETIRSLEGLIDVYLPDFKYLDQELAGKLSGASDYPIIALQAIKEMYRQKGSVLIKNEHGQAESGLIIRHLVLPGYVQNSLNVLRTIAEEISTGVSLSLMSQYYPSKFVRNQPPLDRTLKESEYKLVINEFDRLGFRKGYFQSMKSPDCYLPDFSKDHPFEN